MRPCNVIVGHRQDITAPCEQCRHTNLVHRGGHNPALEACTICEMQLVMPPRQGPTDQPDIPGSLPFVIAHLVVDRTGLVEITTDQARAHSKATELGGLVLDVAASGDYRPSRHG